MNATQLRALAARKAGVDVKRIVGPFDGRQKPARGGLYIRISRKTGEAVWAYHGNYQAYSSWGLYSDTKEGALRKAGKRSKKQLPWFGIAAAK